MNAGFYINICAYIHIYEYICICTHTYICRRRLPAGMGSTFVNRSARSFVIWDTGRMGSKFVNRETVTHARPRTQIGWETALYKVDHLPTNTNRCVFWHHLLAVCSVIRLVIHLEI